MNNNRTNGQSGFTLIELIVVIVILGILAVTAAPKFMNLTSDANASVVKGLAGAIRSSVQLVHAKTMLTFGNKGLNGQYKNQDTGIENQVICVLDECNNEDLTSKKWKGKPGFIYLTIWGYPYSGMDMGAALNVNTILGMLDLGISSDEYSQFDGKGKAPDSSDWIVYDNENDKTKNKNGGQEKAYSMTFVPKSAPASAKHNNYTKDTDANDKNACGVYYRGSNEKKTPVIRVFTKGC